MGRPARMDPRNSQRTIPSSSKAGILKTWCPAVTAASARLPVSNFETWQAYCRRDESRPGADRAHSCGRGHHHIEVFGDFWQRKPIRQLETFKVLIFC